MNKSSGGVKTLLLVGVGALAAYQYLGGPIGLIAFGVVLLLVNH